MNLNWLNQQYLRAPFDDDDHGGGVDEIDDDDLIDDEDQNDDSIEDDDTDDDSSGNQRQRQQPFDMSTLPQAIGQAIAQNMPRQPAQQQQQMSQEDRDKLLKKVRVDEALVQKIWDAETHAERAKAFQEYTDAIVEHALLSSGYMSQYMVQQVAQQVSPLQAHYQEQQLNDFKRSVVQTFPALKSVAPNVIDLAMDAVRKSGQTFQTKKEGITAVARAAAAITRSVNPNFSLKRRQNDFQQPRSLQRGGGGGGFRPGRSGGQADGGVLD